MADRAEVVFTFRDTSPSNSGGGANTETSKATEAAKSAVESAKEATKSVTESVEKTKPITAVTASNPIANFASSAIQTGKSTLKSVASMVNPITATIGVIVGLGFAAKKASDALREIGREVGGMSPQVLSGRARIDQQKFEQDRQRAKRFGSRIARQEEVDARYERAMTELKDDFTDFFSAFGEVWTELKSGLADTIGWLAGVEKNTRKGDNPFTALQGLNEKFEKLQSVANQLRWLQKREGKMGASNNQLAATGIAINGLPMGAK